MKKQTGNKLLGGVLVVGLLATGFASLSMGATAYGDPLVTPTTMQEFTDEYCQTMDIFYGTGAGASEVDKLLTLTDTRNSQDYLVGRLPDGKCWMLNNLRLGSETSDLVLTPEDTNIASTWALPQIDNSAIEQATAPQVYSSALEDDNIENYGFLGYYYNWCAATAGGTASGGSRTCVETNADYPEVPTGDICPIGWSLPLAGGGTVGDPRNSWDNLNATMAGFASNQDPDYIQMQTMHADAYWGNWQFDGSFHTVLAGLHGVIYTTDHWSNIGTHTYWWTVHDSGDLLAGGAMSLYSNNSYVYTNTGFFNLTENLSVRCLAKSAVLSDDNIDSDDTPSLPDTSSVSGDFSSTNFLPMVIGLVTVLGVGALLTLRKTFRK